MSAFPATTIKVTAIEPCGETKVRITMEMIVDVHRLSEIGGEFLQAAVKQAKTERAKIGKA